MTLLKYWVFYQIINCVAAVVSLQIKLGWFLAEDKHLFWKKTKNKKPTSNIYMGHLFVCILAEHLEVNCLSGFSPTPQTPNHGFLKYILWEILVTVDMEIVNLLNVLFFTISFVHFFKNVNSTEITIPQLLWVFSLKPENVSLGNWGFSEMNNTNQRTPHFLLHLYWCISFIIVRSKEIKLLLTSDWIVIIHCLYMYWMTGVFCGVFFFLYRSSIPIKYFCYL